jgi:hypothetical protein
MQKQAKKKQNANNEKTREGCAEKATQIIAAEQQLRERQ